jgi:hypothetical protein
MGGFGINSGSYGIRRIFDSYENLVRGSFPTYLRIRDFPPIDNDEWAQLGFSIAPSGTNPDEGTTDILIQPQPAVVSVSVHNIGQSMGKLRFGARIFAISHTFVLQQYNALGLDGTQDKIWRDEKIVGLVQDHRLFSIEDIQSEQAFGHTVSWVLTCNSAETG